VIKLVSSSPACTRSIHHKSNQWIHAIRSVT
jgi:hypothetical protein